MTFSKKYLEDLSMNEFEQALDQYLTNPHWGMEEPRDDEREDD